MGKTQILDGYIGIGLDHTCKECNFSRNISKLGDFVYRIHWESNDTALVLKDCFSLQQDESYNWFGGPQIYTQLWPIQKLTLNGSDPYVLRKADNFAVAERYWLNSAGTFIFVSNDTPLFVDQNNESPGEVCFIAKVEGPYFNRTKLSMTYDIVTRDNAKDAHLYAVNHYLGKPSGMPNQNMIKEPIWTTWAKYKQPINQEKTLEFANDILNHGFSGQIELDEKWEDCFGTHTFDKAKFPNVTAMVQEIKKNFRMTLWLEPFVNTECKARCLEGEQNGYFVKNSSGSMSTIWWEGNDERQIDFTNPDAANWYSDSVALLRDSYGFDGFKFDAGETNYAPQPSVYENVDQMLIPNIFSERYIRTVAQFGDSVEVRSAFRTQDLPVFLRMIDKDSVWGLDDGLQSLVTTLLQLNMNGYTLVLPDMIGGNWYRQEPTAELIVRWTQATVFMPAMQFGFLPWDYESEQYNSTEIVRRMVNLHKQYSDEIIQAINASINDGTPVNAPIWWIDPSDPLALRNFDEYLLGENILVAPILEAGATSRSVYLPKGLWKDGNNSTLYTGPLILQYDAPIDVLPFFIKK